MDTAGIHILFHTITATYASLIALLYLIKWRNGRAFIALATFLVMGWLAYHHWLAFLNIHDRDTYGAMYIRPFLHAAYFSFALLFTYDFLFKLAEEREIKKLFDKDKNGIFE